MDFGTLLEAFIGTMYLVFHLFLATQLLLHQEAFACEDWEYEIKRVCCRTCGIGYRVLKHCTPNSSTTCIPCTNGTYTEHPNGLKNCFSCRVCDSGIQLQVKEQCSYTKNTVCVCRGDYFCALLNDQGSCEHCEKHTVAPPGTRVTEPGTEIKDTKFEPCPPGTFSETEMSSSCKSWINCSQEGKREVQAGSSTSDAVCEPHSPAPGSTTILSAILVPLLVVCIIGGILIWKRKKGNIKGAAREQERFPVQENGHYMMAPMQETTQNLGEPTFRVA
ncbi:tumor necrosis factor receptor superfamily member 14 [Elgaria multicarinata webbii]|uniref:tumor necrosis factor receptor superfamily member 14 n=1 Tax=Elgaria multicarinata webbii TaxID=159646 RepID=UPI002FCD3256